MAKPFYVTTPIYYINDVPHIGHAYTTIAADVLARYHRQLGDEVFFLTGTDEHGQKIQQAAEAKGESPQALADRVVNRFQELWKILNISHDDFIRTTEARHKNAVRAFFQLVEKKGDIYLGEYEDWYCTPCETFLTEGQLIDGKCPECGRPVKKLKEESFFFKLSRFAQPLLDYYAKGAIQPESKGNEIKSFVNQGLRDLSISRTTFNWGIAIPGNQKHVIYVWFDALFNYVSALGWNTDHDERYKKFWPADVHIVGKDILRFHAVYWQAFLMSAGFPLPKKVFAHGWWTVEGKKMSKSMGNVIDPVEMVERYGADAFRYFLLREVPFGADGNFSIKLLEQRINADLANDIGNLLSRTIGMYQKYFAKDPMPDLDPKMPGAHHEALRALVEKNLLEHKPISQMFEELDFQGVLRMIWEVIAQANLYIDQTQPWNLNKEGNRQNELAGVMYHLLETLRLVTLLIYPFMPAKAELMWGGLGMKKPLTQCVPLQEFLTWGQYPAAQVPTPVPHLFPRIQ